MGEELPLGDHADLWSAILKKKFKDQLSKIVCEYPHYRSLYVDYREVEKSGKPGLTLADELVENPDKSREDIWDAIKNHNLVLLPGNKEIKPDVDFNIRFRNIRTKIKIRELRDHHINSLVSLDALVMRSTQTLPSLTEAIFKCPAGHFTRKHQKINSYVEPEGCETSGCKFKKLDLIPKRSSFLNLQKLKIQETGENLKSGQQPQTLDVYVTDDLCDRLNPGDRATLIGTVRAEQRIVKGNKTSVFDFYMELSAIEKEEEDFEDIEIDSKAVDQIKEIAKDKDLLNKLAHSIAPSIYGMEEVKKAIALQLFSGVYKENNDGTTSRAALHILLVGDPSTAKSALIRYTARMSPRGIFTNMKTSTSAGLIGSVNRDDETGRWVVDMGALSYADMGIAAVDELDKSDDEGREALYEAMQDGCVSINKASIHRSLKARASVLAAANPKGERFDAYGDIADQINMRPAFLSRFDLIFMILDKPNPKEDFAIGNHILTTQYIGECKAAKRTDEISDQEREMVVPGIPTILLRQYISWAQKNVTPVLSKEARQYLLDYYVKTRGAAAEGKPVPITARALEATIRLSEAIARVRLSNDIALKDAEEAIRIFDKCIRAVATDVQTGALDAGKIGDGISSAKVRLFKFIFKEIEDAAKSDDMIRVHGLKYSLLCEKLAQGPAQELDTFKINAALEEMKRVGDLLEPRDGFYKIIPKSK
jgi:replicative DNA helicase Mcm